MRIKKIVDSSNKKSVQAIGLAFIFQGCPSLQGQFFLNSIFNSEIFKNSNEKDYG